MWLDEVKLRGSKVTLLPLESCHKEPLVGAASNGNLWELWYTDVPSPNTIDEYMKDALDQKNAGKALPFVVVENKSSQVIGATRYHNLEPQHRRLEIGKTWYSKTYQRTSVNPECKLLLLTHAFESLHCIAVELRTHIANKASRGAISKLGAKQDGILRNHQIIRNGSYRDSVVFSIIESEWPMVKENLNARLEKYKIKQIP